MKCVLTDMDAKKLEQQEAQLKLLLENLKECYQLACYQAWSLGSSSFVVQNQSNRIYRPIYIVRPHTYSTLSNRIVTRPFLCNAEKMFITHQILTAVSCLHEKGICHGHLTCDNIGLTSWNWVVILDLLPNGARPTFLETSDSSDWINYFQERGRGHVEDVAYSQVPFGSTSVKNKADAGSAGEKRCYIAPERFIRKEGSDKAIAGDLTPSMDIFSLGCVLMELFLNGEPAMDLGDLMEYKNGGDDISKHSSLPQKLNKIESSNIRACCRHMLHLKAEKRLSAAEYLSRLKSSIQSGRQTTVVMDGGELTRQEAPFPSCHEKSFFPLFLRVRKEVLSPDARIALAAMHYGDIIRDTVGIDDWEGENLFGRIIGRTVSDLYGLTKTDATQKYNQSRSNRSYREFKHAICDMECNDLLLETEDLIRKIEMEFGKTIDYANQETAKSKDIVENGAKCSSFDGVRSPSSDALILFTQFVLSTILHAQRPSSKLVGMHILLRISKFSTDDIRLQRIVPHLVSMLNDTEGCVRSLALRTLTKVLSMIQQFPPSDAQIFPKYILKRISHLVNDTILMVRLAFAENIAQLAETALRFLDTCHAIKVYESGEGGFTDDSSPINGGIGEDPFYYENTNVHWKGPFRSLENAAMRRNVKVGTTSFQQSTSGVEGESYKTAILIKDDYDTDLVELQDIFARWIIMITTDTSEYASVVKQAILVDIARLCHLFGSEGVMTCILPQILAFLNHRKDWRLRAALCQSLPSVCLMIGREATQKYVVPCVETALNDEEEIVVEKALYCLSSLVHAGLLTRAVLLGAQRINFEEKHAKSSINSIQGIINRYASLLLHPSPKIRHSASCFFAACSSNLGFPDDEALVAPILRPYLRHDVDSDCITDAKMLFYSLLPSIDDDFHGAYDQMVLIKQLDNLQITQKNSNDIISSFKFYQGISQRRKEANREKVGLRVMNDMNIIADPKSCFSVLLPDQKYVELVAKPLPEWYDELRQLRHSEYPNRSENCTLRCMSLLLKVYSVTILQTLHSAQPQKMWKGDFMAQDVGFESSTIENKDAKKDKLNALFTDAGSLMFNGSSKGEWGSVSLVDPVSLEMSQLVSKLDSIEAPVVPPQLGALRDLEGRSYSCHAPARSNQIVSDKHRPVEWKPRIDNLLCSTLPREHNGPVTRLAVSQDFSFFVSASHDGTCKVFETVQIRDSAGHLKSCLTIGGDDESPSRVNDITILENSKSVASGNSNGSVVVSRIEESTSDTKNTLISTPSLSTSTRYSRVSGSKMVRKLEAHEGEILAVSHFNTNSASIVTYATQMAVHSWDLRCAREPFILPTRPEMGFVTSFSVGNDRNWLCTGSNTGKQHNRI
jgi:phosphoinositide-3-kinase regulatory subunit 4